MKFKPFYVKTEGLTDEQIAAVFDKAVQQGAIECEGVSGFSGDRFKWRYPSSAFTYFGVNERFETYLNGIPRCFGPAAVKLTIDQVDDHLGLTEIQTETPEEKEALDAIDTAPNQYESLSGSEFPSGYEWKPKSGQDVYIAQINTLAGIKEKRYYVHEFWCNSGHQREYLSCGILFPTKEDAELKTKSILGIPVETPEQRNERERLEAAYDLCCLYGHNDFESAEDFNKYHPSLAEKWLLIVDKTGYRKEEKND